MAAKKFPWEPTHNSVIVKKEDAPAGEQKKGKILLPDEAKRKLNIGRVIAVGPGRLSHDGKNSAMSIKPGMRVIYNPYSVTTIVEDEEEFLLMDESSILAINVA